MKKNTIFLVGLPGCGKSYLGKIVSNCLCVSFVDLDEEIVKKEKKNILEIFSQRGEEYFRVLEKETLINHLNHSSKTIVATGGGTPCFFQNMTLMNKHGYTIFINTSKNIIMKHLEKDANERPLLNSKSLGYLLRQRMPFYQKSHHTVFSYEELKKICEMLIQPS